MNTKGKWQRQSGLWRARNSSGQEIYKPTIYPPNILAQIRPYRNSKGQWVILLNAEPRFLHFLESTDNTAITSSRADMCMVSYPFKEQAQAMCDWLKRLWSDDPDVIAEDGDLMVEVDLITPESEK